MALAVFAVCERVRLATGAVSIVLCTLGGAQSMAGKRDDVRRTMGSFGLVVGVGGIGMSGGFEMTTLGSGAGGSVFAGTAHGLQDGAWSGGRM